MFKNIAVINHSDGKSEQIHCSSWECKDSELRMKEPIKHYYSHQHAQDDGWVLTSHRKHHDPDSGRPYSWVCPSCWGGK